MEKIRKEHQRANGLKRAVIGRTIFTLLLATANIGISLVAARIAQDMRASANNALASRDGQRLGTTSKTIEITMIPADESSHRHLEAASNMNCPVAYSCSLQGAITMPAAIRMYSAFCPNWPNDDNRCKGEGVKRLYLNCNGVNNHSLKVACGFLREGPSTLPLAHT